jgi:predicted glutamine amidotransferase
MALVVGKDKAALSNFELVLKTAWAKGNSDGVGIYWRDSATGGRHLTRFEKSADLAKIPEDYDRLLIHFRKSTKGLGTHPFRCRDKPDLNSDGWLLVHNGVVDDEFARNQLREHEFSTLIDSEPFVHVWGELTETDLLARAKAFAKRVDQLGLNGWANLIFYNVVTDEYVVFADRDMEIVENKARDVVVFCSDANWANWTESHKLGVSFYNVSQGTILYGKGLNFKAKKNIWEVKPRQSPKYEQTAMVPAESIPLTDEETQRAIRSLGGGQYGKAVDPELITDDHFFTPEKWPDQDTGEFYCRVCMMGPEYHKYGQKMALHDTTIHLSLKNRIFGVGKKGKAKNAQVNSQLTPSVGRGCVRFKVIPGDPCRPQDNGAGTGICEYHWQQGFRWFSHAPDGWYLVKPFDGTEETKENDLLVRAKARQEAHDFLGSPKE